MVVSKAAKADLESLSIELDTGAGPSAVSLPYTIKDTAANVAAELGSDPAYVTGSTGDVVLTNDSAATDASKLKIVLDELAGGKTADATAITSISGDISDVEAVIDHKITAADTSLAADVAISFDATTDASVAAVNKALAVTTGAVTGTISGAAATLAGLTSEAASKATNSLTLTVSEATAADVAAANLSLVSAATSGAVTVTNKVDVNGDIDAVQAVQALTNVTFSADYTVELSDTGAVSLTDLSGIGGKAAGEVVVANAISGSGTATEVSDAFVAPGHEGHAVGGFYGHRHGGRAHGCGHRRCNCCGE